MVLGLTEHFFASSCHGTEGDTLGTFLNEKEKQIWAKGLGPACGPRSPVECSPEGFGVKVRQEPSNVSYDGSG
jgi:hypothetical protein